MKRFFTILALAAAMVFSTVGCAIFTESPQVVERHYYSPNYSFYPPDGVYYWYGRSYYTRSLYAAPRPPHYPPHAAQRPPHNQPGYTPRLQHTRPEVHRPSPRPPRPSSPSVPAPPRQPANTPPAIQHKTPR